MENMQLNGRNRDRGSRLTWLGSTALLTAVFLLVCATSALAGRPRARLSSDLVAHLNSNSSAAIDIIVSGSQELIARLVKRHSLVVKKVLTSGAVLTVPKHAIGALSEDHEVEKLSGNPVVYSHTWVTAATIGADAAWAGAIATLGAVNGRGIGVAIIDSGIADHPALGDRVVASVDFTDQLGSGRDQYGHGTHIAGIVSARSFRNTGAESGIAPAAHLINLKVLGADGSGRASDVIEAIDWAIRYRELFGIRVLNLSLGTAPTQSYKDDPICQAVERAVKAGLVVVASAGNYGTNDQNQQVFGSITSPGISPYAITVGAIRTHGTVDTSDDEIAPWSSKGPTLIDRIVKPDLVAPGSKIVSTAAVGATLMTQFPERLIDGRGSHDYFTMSGTSMSAAVVSGAVALLLDGRGDLTPLQVKLALQASADFMPEAGLLASGAGSLDLKGLDEIYNLAPTLSGASTGFSLGVPTANGATSQVIVSGDVIVWGNVIVWGDVIVWGNAAQASDVIVWGNSFDDVIVWGNTTTAQDVIVWGNAVSAEDVIVWGNSVDEVIVWGNVIVWGD